MQGSPPRGSFPYVDQTPTLTERLRLSRYALQRAAWRLRYRLPDSDAPPHEPILVVFGMHRSGTSSAVGILEDLGFTVPGTVAPDGTGDNKRGTRELIEMTSLTNRVLQVNDSSWREPPTTPIRYRNTDMQDRNRIIQLCDGRRCVLKDPRMILMLELWNGISINPMGVVRNPVDVAESLVRRGEPLTHQQGVALWKTYNRALLNFAQTHDCPIAFFDHPRFEDQVVLCTRRLGYNSNADTHFFDDRLVRSRSEDWREVVKDREAVALYDNLTRFDVAFQSASPAGDGA